MCNYMSHGNLNLNGLNPHDEILQFNRQNNLNMVCNLLRIIIVSKFHWIVLYCKQFVIMSHTHTHIHTSKYTFPLTRLLLDKP